MFTLADEIMAHLCKQLAVDEDKRYALYDDATARNFLTGDTLRGNLTGGIGHNFMVPLDDDDIRYFLEKDITKAALFCSQFLWFQIQDDVRQVALLNLVFNLGQTGLLHWPHFLACMAQKDYSGAVEQVQTNHIWVAQVGARAARIEAMILSGHYPGE